MDGVVINSALLPKEEPCLALNVTAALDQWMAQPRLPALLRVTLVDEDGAIVSPSMAGLGEAFVVAYFNDRNEDIANRVKVRLQRP